MYAGHGVGHPRHLLSAKTSYGLEGRPHLRIDGLGQVARTFDGCASMFLDDVGNPVLQFIFTSLALNQSCSAD